IKMIRSRDIDQLVASWKFMRQQVKEFKSTNDKAYAEAGDGDAKQDQQDPKVPSSFMSLREQIESHAHERHGDRDQRDETNKAIEHDREQRARFSVRLLEYEITLDDVSTGAAREELIVKHADQEQPPQSGNGESDSLDL